MGGGQGWEGGGGEKEEMEWGGSGVCIHVLDNYFDGSST